MKGFFSKLISPPRRPRRGSRPAEPDDGAAQRDSTGSQGMLEIRIDERRNSGSPPQADSGRWAEPAGAFRGHDVGHSNFGLASTDGRIAIVGSGNFGVQCCSKEDFMQIQSTVMEAFARAEAQFGDDEEFAEEIESEIDILFDEFEQLKELLVRAQRGECDTDIERDVIRLKARIHDVVGRINEREHDYCARKGKITARSSGSSGSDEVDTGRRSIGKLRLDE